MIETKHHESEAARLEVVRHPEPSLIEQRKREDAEERRQFEEMFPTPKFIKGHGGKTSLEMNIAEMAKRCEEEANKVVEFADPKRCESEAVTAALEPVKATALRLSRVKRREVISSGQIALDPPDDVVFQHSLFCQTALPYRDPGPDIREWHRRQGKAVLLMSAGHVLDTSLKEFVPVGLPYGPAARLILTYLNTQALRTQNRVIDTHDDSLTAFVRRLRGFSPNGKEIARAKEQLLRLSACTIRMGFFIGDVTRQLNMQIISGLGFRERGEDGEHFVFPKQIALDINYAESLFVHAVPLDERAIAALSHTAMGLDLYSWLAQRLHRVDPERGQIIPWTALHAQFGQGYEHVKFFRRVFKTALNQVLTQYPEARVKTDEKGLLLGHSPSPVASNKTIYLPNPKDPPKRQP